MDSLGEVGKKMRSAIKAKLVELGNASQTGYIDDELPDYVMIMVANKRSKQQMLTDLNLFLGSNTESFVTWLHQVLQKLQEVTLPSSLASKAKKKSNDSSGKKDKKKDKKKGSGSSKEPSITDVIAVELMEKAKKTIDPKVKKEEEEDEESTTRTPSPPPAPPINPPEAPRISSSRNKEKEDDELNIPTISEITTSAGTQNLHKKELIQLEEIQNRIYQAKQKLRSMPDDDKGHEEEYGGDGVDDAEEEDDEPMISDREQQERADQSDEERSKLKSPKVQQNNRVSVKSRLGEKTLENSKSSTIISLSAIRKTENELFTSTSSFRRLIERQKEENERRDDRKPPRNRFEPIAINRNRRERRSRSRSPDRYNRNRERPESNRGRRRSRSRSPLRRSQERKSRPSIRQRIGNRAISPKRSKSKSPTADNYRVKQRPALSSAISANAGKNLLLRAMAEARRSTSTSTVDIRKKPRDHIVVQVRNERRNPQMDEEYVPESISGHSESEAEYHASFKREPPENMEDDADDVIVYNDGGVDLDDLEDNNEAAAATATRSPKFVVTFNKGPSDKYDQNTQSSHSPTPPPVIKRRSIKDRIGQRNNEKHNNHENNSSGRHEESRKRKRNDDVREEEEAAAAAAEEEECESQRAYNKVRKTRVSPIKFDLTDDENDDGKSTSSHHDKKTHAKNDNDKSELNGDEHKRIRLETSRSFDHVPSLLSSVAVPVTDPIIKPVVKTKERCKFYPACSNANCTFHHPSLPCKIFPNCKFGDSCAYVHPKCKFDVSCNRIDCNFTHTPIAAASNPIVASSIVPAQNYKSITITPNSTICKFFPNCTNTNCIYQHPKICKFGKSCANKYECNFYHFEMSSKNKFKWISPLS